MVQASTLSASLDRVAAPHKMDPGNEISEGSDPFRPRPVKDGPRAQPRGGLRCGAECPECNHLGCVKSYCHQDDHQCQCGYTDGSQWTNPRSVNRRNLKYLPDSGRTPGDALCLLTRRWHPDDDETDPEEPRMSPRNGVATSDLEEANPVEEFGFHEGSQTGVSVGLVPTEETQSQRVRPPCAQPCNLCQFLCEMT